MVMSREIDVGVAVKDRIKDTICWKVMEPWRVFLRGFEDLGHLNSE